MHSPEAILYGLGAPKLTGYTAIDKLAGKLPRRWRIWDHLIELTSILTLFCWQRVLLRCIGVLQLCLVKGSHFGNIGLVRHLEQECDFTAERKR